VRQGNHGGGLVIVSHRDGIVERSPYHSGNQAVHAPTRPLPAPSGWSAAGLLSAAALVLVALAGWWSAGGFRSTDDLGLAVGHLASGPDAVSVPEYNDLFFTLALGRAASEGRVIPGLPRRIPELGAPQVADWSDWPLIEEPLTLLLGGLSRMVGPFPALNLALALAHALAAVTMGQVALRGGAAPPWAFLAGVAYGLAPFLFAQSPHHLTVVWAWHVPLFIPAWRWASDPAIGPGDRRFLAAAAIGAIAGVQNPYYTVVLCQLALLAGGMAAWRGGSWQALRVGGVIVLAASIAFGLMHLDTLVNGWTVGRNPAVVQREYKWLEIYGLKLVDLVVPSAEHRVPWMAWAGTTHRASTPLLDEGASYLGLLGIGCLAWLVAVAVTALVERRADRVPTAFWQVAWIVLVFTTGGLNAFAGSAGFLMFRAGCRFSIVILAIVLEWAARRMSAAGSDGAITGSGVPAAAPRAAASLGWAIAVLLAGLVFHDQVPRAPDAGDLRAIGERIASDRAFFARLEESLPAGAMVLQIPLMDFPESPAPGVSAYDQLRPYALGSRLHWSFGTVKGRPRDPSIRALQGKDVRTMVAILRQRGFSAVVVHRGAFADRARDLEAKLLAAAGAERLVISPAGDLSGVVLGAERP